MPDRQQIAKAKAAGTAAGSKNQNRTGANRWASKQGKGNQKLAEVFDAAWVQAANEAGHS